MSHLCETYQHSSRFSRLSGDRCLPHIPKKIFQMTLLYRRSKEKCMSKRLSNKLGAILTRRWGRMPSYTCNINHIFDKAFYCRPMIDLEKESPSIPCVCASAKLIVDNDIVALSRLSIHGKSPTRARTTVFYALESVVQSGTPPGRRSW